MPIFAPDVSERSLDFPEGRRGRARHTRPVAVFALCLVCLMVPPGSPVAADLDDLLLDLQIVPLGDQPAPGFTLESLGGKKVSLGDFRGRAVLLYFWATW